MRAVVKGVRLYRHQQRLHRRLLKPPLGYGKITGVLLNADKGTAQLQASDTSGAGTDDYLA